MIVELPKDIFAEVEAEELIPGNVLPMQDSLGRHLNGTIVTVGDDHGDHGFQSPDGRQRFVFQR